MVYVSGDSLTGFKRLGNHSSTTVAPSPTATKGIKPCVTSHWVQRPAVSELPKAPSAEQSGLARLGVSRAQKYVVPLYDRFL
jgi:hypothetical protein